MHGQKGSINPPMNGNGFEMQKRLRVYFELLLFLTMVNFLVLMGYVFVPIFRDNSPMGRPCGGMSVMGSGVINVEQPEVDISPKHRLRIDQLVAEGAVVPKAPAPVEPKANPPTKSQNPPGGANAQPPNPPAQPAGGAANAKPPEPAKPAAPVKKKRKKMFVLAGMQIVEKWSELTTLVAYLKEKNPKSDGVTYRVVIDGPDPYEFNLDFTFSSNYSKEIMLGKDAVIFNVAPYTLLTNIMRILEHEHPKDQLHMIYGVETALRVHKWIKNIGNLPVHGVWSYQSDSEIHMPYAYYQPGPPVTDTTKKSPNFWVQSKSSLVAWMGSNCVKEVFWPRMQFIEDLAKHVPVHTYGKCGNLTCLPRLSEECKNQMASYQFYLAFENAECGEYISEKTWNTCLQHGIVPVVYGPKKADYERLAPPNSFIYAGDFKSTKELGEYLLKLDKDPDEYAKYFEWRYKGTVVQVYPELRPTDFCKVVPLMEKVKKGELEKKPIYTFPWYSACRSKIVKPHDPKDILSLNAWNPW